MRFKHYLILISGIVVLAACTQSSLRSHHQVAAKPWTITLLVTGNGAGASMKVKTGPMPKCRTTADGCMIFQSNEKGEVTFGMSGNDTGWHITQLKICKGESPPVPLDKDCPLFANAFDFYVDKGGVPTIPNLFTGKINWEYADAVKTFVLNDQNVLKQKYYYMVEACDAANNCKVADPPVDNKGVK